MSQQYLERFRSSLPTIQGKQILNLLISKRDSGEIRTIDEFKKRLTDLTQILLSERITPTIKLFLAIGGEDTSSEQLNEMIDRIRDDLEAAFSEADNIDEIINAHHNIINNVVLKSLRFGINELESKINLYEFLNKSGMGFDDALFNTFRESKNLQTNRTDSAANLVYIDPRFKTFVPLEENSFKDPIGERILLGISQEKFVSIKESEWLSNVNSIRSELDVTFSNIKISNITDGLNNTFWVIPILLKQIRNSGVPMEIILKLNSIQDVNFIEIEPATDFPMVLVGIDYIDANNIRRSTSSDIGEFFLDGPKKVNFERITTSGIILRVRQDNYTEIQFTQKPGESNFHKAVLGQSLDNIDLQSINQDLKNILSSNFILSDIFSIVDQSLIQRKYFQYILGFDNIRIGFGTFQERGIFASIKKTIDRPGQLGLKTIERRPVQISGSNNILLQEFNYPLRSIDEDEKFYHGSIEYWLTLQIFGDNDFLIDTVIVPILPLGSQRIYHERIVFSKKSQSSNQNSDLGSLIFYTDPDPLDVIVYRNGTPLVYGTNSTADWEFVGEIIGDKDIQGNELQVIDPDITVSIPNSGFPMKRGIHIWKDVRPLDIYTISYTPKTSNTHVIPKDTTLLQTIDLVGDLTIRLVNENVIVIDTMKRSQTISKIDTYLSIILRRNSANLNFSPSIEEYMLISGTKNQKKFIT